MEGDHSLQETFLQEGVAQGWPHQCAAAPPAVSNHRLGQFGVQAVDLNVKETEDTNLAMSFGVYLEKGSTDIRKVKAQQAWSNIAVFLFWLLLSS